ACIATRAIAGKTKKVFADAPCDDPRALVSGVIAHVPPAATGRGDERSVGAVSSGRSPNLATAADFSIATTASPCSGIPHCSSGPSDASAEMSFRIPSTNTLGFAALVGVAFSGKLTDLDWGSWEGSLPESSSLGGDRTPLRGAFMDSAFGRDSRTHYAGETL